MISDVFWPTTHHILKKTMRENGQFEAIRLPFIYCFSVEGTKINKNHSLLPVKINIYYQQAFF